jgi:hypothetical protein
MKPAPALEPCDVEALIPEPLLRASDDAGRRKNAALDRLMIKLDVSGRGADLERLIDADKERGK